MATISTIVSLLLVIFKAIPIMKDWWEKLLAMYIEKQDELLKEELRLAIYNSVHQQDQRGIEDVIGNPNAGKPVDIPDSEIVDELPGVRPHPPNKILILFMMLALSGCVTRKQIEAATWVNNFNSLSPELCYPAGPLYRVGFFRRLDDGKFQFVSACSPTGAKMLSVTAEDYKKILDAALERKR
jgi:hypothetical protein